MKPDCQACANSYQGADLKLRCRRNGLQASPANADKCKHYEREAGADDVLTPWCGSACYEAESRN